MALLVAGVVLGQLILYGPSLAGRKVLLPLDHLAARPRVYLPSSAETRGLLPHDFARSDLVLIAEPGRQFALSEIRAGRWPVWTPYQNAGSPFLSAVYSPFYLLGCCVASPVVLAWLQLLLAVYAAAGAFFFCRRALKVGPWPALIGAWCWPLSGYFVLWQGFDGTFGVGGLPWLLWAVDEIVRRRSRWAGPGLAASTYLVVTAGQLDVSALVLLTSGLYAAWCLLDEHGRRVLSRRGLSAVAVLACGWLLGILLAAPFGLPLMEYARTGVRMERRSKGAEERPPVGWAALPQVVLPDMYGSTRRGSVPIFPKGQSNLMESSAAAYAGLLATLLAAPLAWCSRRHRSINVFWSVLGILALGWCLDIPPLVRLMRMPGPNLLSFDRSVFAASFAILAMTAVGLDVLWRGRARQRTWAWLPGALLAALFFWSAYRTAVLPEALAGTTASIQEPFRRFYATATVLCGLGIAGWLLLGTRWRTCPWLAPALGALLVAELLWFARDRSAQCEPGLYYPRIPALEQLADAAPGRVIGYHCLPPTLSQTHGLRDIRGYDAVDPAQLVDLLRIGADPGSPVLPYAVTQWLRPRIALTPSGSLRLSPVLDMLNVRYVVFRGAPPRGMRPDFSSPDYWVLTNRRALPRAFVPSRVETVGSREGLLEKLGAADFDARQTAYVEVPVRLPAPSRGSAEILAETPTRISLSCDMETDGLVVLADRWDAGWKAYLDGRPMPILRTDHALRGVVMPAGKRTLDFRYEPSSAAMGWRLCGLAAAVLAGWACLCLRTGAGAVEGL